MTRWSGFQREDPQLADAIRARFEANPHHVLGTIRASGAPRLSGTEVHIFDDVHVGIMPGAARLKDIDMDPRVEIHSAPLEPDLANGDARLSGRLQHLGGTDFALDISRVTLVKVRDDQLVHRVWRPGHGTLESRRR